MGDAKNNRIYRTKAKAKKRTAKVWLVLNNRGRVRFVEPNGKNAKLLVDREGGETVVPATLTWSEPARRTQR
jgi:ABC-type hemin transport system substrate-binding protein